MSYVVYDYECETGGCLYVDRDRWVKAGEKDAQFCPECGRKLRRNMPSPQTTFKFADKSSFKKGD